MNIIYYKLFHVYIKFDFFSYIKSLWLILLYDFYNKMYLYAFYYKKIHKYVYF